MKLTFDYGSRTFSVDLAPSGKSFRASMGKEFLTAGIRSAENGRLDLSIDGRIVAAYISTEGAKTWVTLNGRTVLLAKAAGAGRGPGREPAGSLAAPMPGQVRSVNIRAGESVRKGQTLLVIEAMKMEIRIQAPKDGVVRVLRVKQGDTVEREQILIEVTE
jgi:biotin carboxyl carrier protein